MTDPDTNLESLRDDDIDIILDLITERLHNPPHHPVSCNITSDGLLRILSGLRTKKTATNRRRFGHREFPTLQYAHDDGGQRNCDTLSVFPDTAVRAAAILTRTPYDTLFHTFAAIVEQHGYHFEPMSEYEPQHRAPAGYLSPYDVRAKLLRSAGLTRTNLPKKPWLALPEIHRQFGDCIIETSQSFSAIVDGTLRDLSDNRFLSNRPYFADHLHYRKAAAVWTVASTPPLLEPAADTDHPPLANQPAQPERHSQPHRAGDPKDEIPFQAPLRPSLPHRPPKHLPRSP